jgi:hypothetical protein
VEALGKIVSNKRDEIFGKLPWRERNENLAKKSRDFSNVKQNDKGE